MKRAFIGVTLLLVLAAGGAWWWIRQSLPSLDGEWRLAGLGGPVEVLSDGYGVPHVYARDTADAWFVAGALHARDRRWQMELYRRAAYGRLSEVLGATTLASWLIIAAFFRYSSLASIVAAGFAPFYQLLIWGVEPVLMCIVPMSLLLIWRHEGNIRKLLAGTESKIGQKAAPAAPAHDKHAHSHAHGHGHGHSHAKPHAQTHRKGHK